MKYDKHEQENVQGPGMYNCLRVLCDMTNKLMNFWLCNYIPWIWKSFIFENNNLELSRNNDLKQGFKRNLNSHQTFIILPKIKIV